MGGGGEFGMAGKEVGTIDSMVPGKVVSGKYGCQTVLRRVNGWPPLEFVLRQCGAIVANDDEADEDEFAESQ